jgi:protein involved in ribonucleotide reduction
VNCSHRLEKYSVRRQGNNSENDRIIEVVVSSGNTHQAVNFQREGGNLPTTMPVFL